MTRETKVGLMMVALLVGVFGFLLYKRIHQPLEGLADQEKTRQSSDELDGSPGDGEPDPLRNEEDSLTLQKPFAVKANRPKVETAERPSIKLPQKFSVDDEEFGDSNFSQPKQKRAASSKSETDDDAFDQFTTESSKTKGAPLPAKTSDRRMTVKAVPRELPIEPADDVFDEPRASSQKVIQIAAAETEPLEAPEESDAAEEETPFSESEPPSHPLSVPEVVEDDADSKEPDFNPNPAGRSIAIKDSRGNETKANSRIPAGSGSTDPRMTRTEKTAAVQQAGDFENGLESVPREQRRSAPVTLEDRSFSPEGSSRQPLSGPTYVIEANDSFWSISRKKYGVGRYYMALARHNEQAIPDPKRMKPGVTISTPDTATLEQKYADLIPKAAPAEPAPVVKAQSRKMENPGPDGFFVSTDGNPMYRISGKDTLSEIAKTHLGRSSRWVQILEMNRNVLQDGNELKIGTVLRLPADASQVQIVGRPREGRY
jgi:nucleoid-associated protein YgaU